MRIVFIGAVQFSRRALECVLALDAEVVGICTQATSSFNADHCDLRALSENNGIPSLDAQDLNSQASLQWIRDCRPDVIFCFGWSRLLRKPLLDVAPLGVVGFHPAALPANRGRHPLIWALVLGLTQTATTFFFMDESADGGDILSQRALEISEFDDAGSLYEKMTRSALLQIEEFVPQLTAGKYPRIRQDASNSNSWRKRARADGQIDWRMSARSIRNLVRGLARPYAGAHFRHRDSDVKVWAAEIIPGTAANIEPGKVVQSGAPGPVIVCGEGAIRLLECEPPALLATGEYL
ncbi:MAG TPA: formyltransferase family protein [Steroidobacteraceae bacterium]|nr:formyltransferase family protein [Steroidobacteraceae bacterium]